ncbi:MAG: hypothetical protein CVU16_13375 [Betaproteobacteria bacterium HGW-Betaproteobacteria-10]|jgi:hypothetical protein|nr:MAG: hypothetical protein CVU16_13375 [Betaproteobacteria bacterium HGW-Betaproteobacteria-10]
MIYLAMFCRILAGRCKHLQAIAERSALSHSATFYGIAEQRFGQRVAAVQTENIRRDKRRLFGNTCQRPSQPQPPCRISLVISTSAVHRFGCSARREFFAAVGEPSHGLDAVQSSGFQQGFDNRSTPTGGPGAGKERVFSCYRLSAPVSSVGF